ncbi:unnamed protein product [Scytosiphon promiscuus]
MWYVLWICTLRWLRLTFEPRVHRYAVSQVINYHTRNLCIRLCDERPYKFKSSGDTVSRAVVLCLPLRREAIVMTALNTCLSGLALINVGECVCMRLRNMMRLWK